MIEILLTLYGVIILVLLIIEIILLDFWSKEHAILMDVISKTLVAIKQKIN